MYYEVEFLIWFWNNMVPQQDQPWDLTVFTMITLSESIPYSTW